jgi:hypothetical protein
MRCTQDYGLPGDAIVFLAEHAIKEWYCEHCGRYSGYKVGKLGQYGMFHECSLKRYHLKDGGVAEEFVQYEYWWSGPMIWLGLKVVGDDGETFVWDDEAIAKECSIEPDELYPSSEEDEEDEY